jgi:hypothetical protein
MKTSHAPNCNALACDCPSDEEIRLDWQETLDRLLAGEEEPPPWATLEEATAYARERLADLTR